MRIRWFDAISDLPSRKKGVSRPSFLHWTWGAAMRQMMQHAPPQQVAVANAPRAAWAAASRISGNQARLQQISPRVQPKLEIGAENDPLEHEADAVADRVMRMPDPGLAVSAAPVQVSRKCATCESEDQKLQMKPATASGALHQAGVQTALAAPGKSLDPGARRFIEPRLGQSVGDVRIHDGAAAAAAARSIGARAFTTGRDIVFNTGEYAPDSIEGRRLLVHELAHVGQQSGGTAIIQRKCGHDGTAVNCHNWGLGLYPWLAGIYAHMQLTAWTGILPHSIPRASKLFMHQPSSPLYPRGFADIWRNAGDVEIAEIKSTATGSAVAAEQAEHYILRHDEATARGPVDADDTAYLADVGGSKKGAPLNLKGKTGGGTAVGAFVGDPGKQLWAEADDLGAMVYWCTGAGLPSPLWLVAFKAAMAALKKKLDELKKRAGELVDTVVAGGHALARWIAGVISRIVNWGTEHSRILALVALLLILVAAIILLIISLLAEAPSAGTSTAPAAASLLAIAGAASGIMALFGASAPGLGTASVAVLNAVNPAQADAAVSPQDYDPKDDKPPPSAGELAAQRPADPGTQMTTALAAFSDPQGLASGALTAFFNGTADQAAALAAAHNAIDTLRANGATADADAAVAQMQRTGLA